MIQEVEYDRNNDTTCFHGSAPIEKERLKYHAFAHSQKSGRAFRTCRNVWGHETLSSDFVRGVFVRVEKPELT